MLKTLEEEVIDAYDTTVRRLKAFKDKEYAKKIMQKFLGDISKERN